MDQSDHKRPSSSIEDSVQTTPDGHALPRILDKTITLDVVQRYVETERARNRRALLWIGTIFLFSVLFVLVLFVGIGVFVLRNVRASANEVNKAAEEVHEIRDKSASLAADMVDVTNKLVGFGAAVDDLEKGNENIIGEIKNYQENVSESDAALKKDLVKFRNWVVSLNSKESKTADRLEARIAELQKTARASQAELTTVRKKYSELVAANIERRSTIDSDEDLGVNNGADNGVDNGVDSGNGNDIAKADIPDQDLSPDQIEDIFGDINDVGPKVDGEPEGEISVVTFPNGDKYEGEFKNGFFNGWGTLHYRNGDKYEGEFKNDVMSGRGAYHYKNGSRFEGEFKNNMKEGKGRFLFKNGDRYGGEFKNDMINGKGTMIYANGNKYSGDFRNGMKSGNGVFSFSNSDVFQGDFSDDLRHGRGKYLFANGAKYIGEFKQGKKHGAGRYIYPDGQEYRGAFKDGKKHGKGVCIYPNGRERSGFWENDEFVRDLK